MTLTEKLTICHLFPLSNSPIHGEGKKVARFYCNNKNRRKQHTQCGTLTQLGLETDPLVVILIRHLPTKSQQPY